MKKLITKLALPLLLLSSNVQAVTIFEMQDGVEAYADSVVNSIGDFYDQDFAGLASPIDNAKLNSNVTGSNLSTYAWSAEGNLPSGQGGAYIDFSFGQNIYNGEGNDLILFFAGTGTEFINGDVEEFLFSIDVGIDGTMDGSSLSVTASETSSIYGDMFYASYAVIDLGQTFNGATPLGNIRLFMDDSSMPAIAAFGAYHTNATVVPVPLSAVLFGSGLALFSLFRRKSKQ